MRACLFLAFFLSVAHAELKVKRAWWLDPARLVAIAVDPEGYLYVAAEGAAAPTTGPDVEGPGGYLQKWSPDGVRIWSRYLYRGFASSIHVAVDAKGNPYVGGTAYAEGLPVTEGAILREQRGPEDGFVVKLSADGKEVRYATFLGMRVSAFGVTGGGEAVVANSYAVAKLNQDGTGFVYSRTGMWPTRAMAVDRDGSVALAGSVTLYEEGDGPMERPRDADLHVSRDGGDTWTSFSGGAMTFRVALDPSNPDRLLRATYGGLLESTDGGRNWRPGPGLENEPLEVVWFHPGRPKLALASGVRERIGRRAQWRSDSGGVAWLRMADVVEGLTAFFSAGQHILGLAGGAVLRSSDEGRTWNGIRTGLFDGTATCCAVDPRNPDRFLVGSTSNTSFGWGILETRDGGDSFRQVSRDSVLPLAFDPGQAELVYGSDSHAHRGIVWRGINPFGECFLRSEDGGKTWRLPLSRECIPTGQVFVDPRFPGRVYSIGTLGVARSDDYGETWAGTKSNLENMQFTSGAVRFGDPDQLYLVARRTGDGWAAKLDAQGKLLWRTLAGGSSMDLITSLSLGPGGDVLVAGATRSVDLFTEATPFRRVTGGYQDGFVSKLAGGDGSLLALRYFGGDSTETANSVVVDPTGSVMVSGLTTSPEWGEFSPGLWKAFVPELSGDLEDRRGAPGRIGSHLGLGLVTGLYEMALSRNRLFVRGYSDSRSVEGLLPQCTTDQSCTNFIVVAERED